LEASGDEATGSLVWDGRKYSTAMSPPAISMRAATIHFLFI
jgi:hypothetical protein